MRAYVVGHWRGELPLGQSYWVNGVLIGIPFNIYSQILQNADQSAMGTVSYVTAFGIYLVSMTPWAIWWAVGIIRSGSTHIQETGRKFWARVAQFMGCLNLVLLPFITYFAAAVLWNLGSAALGKDGLVPAELSIGDEGHLVLRGHITSDVPKRFREMLDANDGVQIVRLESWGGYSGAALEMAKLIRERQLDTYTAVECDSACTYLFVAGDTRYLDFDGVLGFHLGGMAGLPDSVVDAADRSEDTLFLEQGVPDAFVQRIKEIASNEMWVPTLAELVEANVVTHVYDYVEDITYEAAEYCADEDCGALPPHAGIYDLDALGGAAEEETITDEEEDEAAL